MGIIKNVDKLRITGIEEDSANDKVLTIDDSGLVAYKNRLWYEQIAMDISKQSTFEANASEADFAKHGNDIYRVFRIGTNHIGIDGTCIIEKTSDNGKTWGDRKVVYANENYDIRNSTFGIIENVFFVFFRRYASGGDIQEVFFTTSQDLGGTWTEPISMNATLQNDNMVPFGKVMHDGDRYISSFYDGSGSIATCVWLESVNGLDWTYYKEIYSIPHTGSLALNESYFEYLGNGRFIGLIRNQAVINDSYYQISSVDNGETWSEPQETNHGKFLRVAPFLFYDKENDILYTSATPRYNDSATSFDLERHDYSRFYLFANKPDEVINDPNAYRLISTQKMAWQFSDTYGYPTAIKVAENRMLFNFGERYYFLNNSVERANIFQFYVESKLGSNILAPTVDNSRTRVSNEYGILESRSDNQFPMNYKALNTLSVDSIVNSGVNLLKDSNFTFSDEMALAWEHPAHNKLLNVIDGTANYEVLTDSVYGRLDHNIYLKRGIYTFSLKSFTKTRFEFSINGASRVSYISELPERSDYFIHRMTFYVSSDSNVTIEALYKNLGIGDILSVENFVLKNGWSASEWTPSIYDYKIGGYNYIKESNARRFSVTVTGGIQERQDAFGYYVKVEEGVTYTLSRSDKTNNRYYYSFCAEIPENGSMCSARVDLGDVTEHTLTVPLGYSYIYLFLQLGDGGEIYNKQKFEKGHVATDFTPNPSDQVTDFREEDTSSLAYLKGREDILKLVTSPDGTKRLQVNNDGTITTVDV